MFPHEQYLKYALQDCMITKLVQDLGTLYVQLVANDKDATHEEFQTAIKVDRILQEAASKLADLGPKPTIRR